MKAHKKRRINEIIADIDELREKGFAMPEAIQFLHLISLMEVREDLNYNAGKLGVLKS